MANHRNGSASIAKLALVIGLIAPLLVVVGAIGTKLGLIDWKVGFGDITIKWARWAAYAGLAFAVLALVLSFRSLKREWVWLLFAFVLPGLVLGGLLRLKAQADSVPPIHDVSTNWEEPLGFSTDLMADRADAPNKIEADPRLPADAKSPWAGKRVAEINAATCPGAKPIPRYVEPDEMAAAFEAAGVTVRGRAPWRVEGTHESFWFGFKDDVVARMRPERTDIRSVSRVGRSDLGANCARITRIVEALQRPTK